MIFWKSGGAFFCWRYLNNYLSEWNEIFRQLFKHNLKCSDSFISGTFEISDFLKKIRHFLILALWIYFFKKSKCQNMWNIFLKEKWNIFPNIFYGFIFIFCRRTFYCLFVSYITHVFWPFLNTFFWYLNSLMFHLTFLKVSSRGCY